MRTQSKKSLGNGIELSKGLKLFGILLVMTLLASGCALTKDHVVLSYDPQTNVQRMERADAVKVKVEISDVRTIKDKVSSKKNSYGMEMAPIIAQNDVVDLLKKAIEAELKNRGFELADGSVQVLAELNKCYNDFKTGFWSGRAVAEVVMNIQVKKPDKSILYSKLITGEYTHTVQLASGKNAKIALDGALKDAMSKLFADPAFIDSCFKGCLTQ